MGRLIKARKHGKDEFSHFNNKVLSEFDLLTLIGATPIVLRLRSDDLLVVREDYKDYSDNYINSTASIITNEPIYGDCVLAEPQEISKSLWPKRL